MLLSKAFRWLRGTPHRTFIAYPILVLLVARRVKRPLFLPLLAWGYLQYRLVRDYRQKLHAGSFGFGQMPERIITSGPYRWTRNPMYLGHLIFMLGLGLSTGSKLAWAILLGNMPWFNARVEEDEARLRQKFGGEYEAYCRRVRRWL